MICLVVSVLPAPDSPDTRMDCECDSFTMCETPPQQCKQVGAQLAELHTLVLVHHVVVVQVG